MFITLSVEHDGLEIIGLLCTVLLDGLAKVVLLCALLVGLARLV